MKLINDAKDLSPGSGRVCVAIGVFDGVHLGHQQIIRQTVSDARRHGALAAVITFDRHPNSIVAPDRVPLQVSSRTQKIRAIAALGADVLLEIPFDKSFSEKSGEVFIRELAQAAGKIISICVGADFVFGHRRSGNVTLLKTLGAEIGFEVHGHAAVALDGAVVSSTRIREAIGAGDLDAASQMLGRPYAIAGLVKPGDRLGRTLGFPTANLEVVGRILPPSGVYAATTQIGERTYRAALNIGRRPTVVHGALALRVEAHLLDFTGDLYGMELELILARRLRAEHKFASLEALQAQIAHDVANVRAAD